MKEAYEEIQELDKKDNCTIGDAVMKFNEEFGELCTEINKTTGRKLSTDTPKQIKANILEEGADSLQNLFLIMSRYGFSLDEISAEISKKNKKWASQVDKRQEVKKKKSVTGFIVETGHDSGYESGEFVSSEDEAINMVHEFFLDYDFEIREGKPYDAGNDAGTARDDGFSCFGDYWTIITHEGQQKVTNFTHCDGEGPVGSYRKN